MIKAEVVADSLSPQGERLTSFLITFPRIVLAEVNTHRMLSKNTSSSRAIPLRKMIEAIQENPFIPIAWQKNHSGMQGTEYFTKSEDIEGNIRKWLTARDNAINSAKWLNTGYPDDELGIGVTKQLCNRLLEPFMWTTMLITGSKEGWDNFFDLRCPSYNLPVLKLATKDGSSFKSRKDAIKMFPKVEGYTELDWLKCNKGQAEIHIMDLAEKIYDAMNESTPKQLQEGQWHIPFEDKLSGNNLSLEEMIKCSVAMAARTSYTVVGDEKEINYERMIELHDRLIAQNPPHSSPMEHCARAMSYDEYYSYIRGYDNLLNDFGWCRNFKGFVQYRHIVENEN